METITPERELEAARAEYVHAAKWYRYSGSDLDYDEMRITKRVYEDLKAKLAKEAIK